jgi:hypothetical protein
MPGETPGNVQPYTDGQSTAIELLYYDTRPVPLAAQNAADAQPLQDMGFPKV